MEHRGSRLSHILMIDDNEIDLLIHEKLLRSWGFKGEFGVAGDGYEALEYIWDECLDRHRYPDLILLNLDMPFMDGFQFMEHYHFEPS